MDATTQFNGAASLNDHSKRKKKDEEGNWKGAEDVEKLCDIFTTFIT